MGLIVGTSEGGFDPSDAATDSSIRFPAVSPSGMRQVEGSNSIKEARRKHEEKIAHHVPRPRSPAALALGGVQAAAGPDSTNATTGVTSPLILALIGNDDLFATVDLRRCSIRAE